jgi:hypothetical protein
MSELSLGTLSGLAANSYVIDVASGSTLDLSEMVRCCLLGVFCRLCLQQKRYF